MYKWIQWMTQISCGPADLQGGGLICAPLSIHRFLPPLDGYINILMKQPMHVCMMANSSSVGFYWGCFLRHVRRPWVPGLSLIGSAGCQQKSYTGAVELPTRLVSDVIYWFGYFWGYLQHQWVHCRGVHYLTCVFFPATSWLPHHP